MMTNRNCEIGFFIVHSIYNEIKSLSMILNYNTNYYIIYERKLINNENY